MRDAGDAQVLAHEERVLDERVGRAALEQDARGPAADVGEQRRDVGRVGRLLAEQRAHKVLDDRRRENELARAPRPHCARAAQVEHAVGQHRAADARPVELAERLQLDENGRAAFDGFFFCFFL